MKRIIVLSSVVCLFATISVAQSTKVKIETSKGTMVAILYDDTPLHRDNFIKLVNEGFYDDLLFHRVIKNFMIQGGDPNSKNAPEGMPLGMGGPDYTIPAEILPNHFHKKGTLCAARTNNPQKASSGSQFYISQGQVYTDQQLDMMEKQMGRTPVREGQVSASTQNAAQQNNQKFNETKHEAYATIGGIPHLDGEYTVFGEVIEGLDVIDKIANVETLQDGSAKDRPIQDVKIIKISIIK